MLFTRRKRRQHWETKAAALYGAMVTLARRPLFYRDFGVADSVEGRFDVLALHMSMLMRRLGAAESGHQDDAKALMQELANVMFADMDINLRESGVSDMSIGKKVRKLAEGFYGRLAAYDKAMADGGGAMLPVVARNVFRSENLVQAEPIVALATALAHRLDATPTEDLLQGQFTVEAVP